jgi:hypothetical protein
MLPITNASLVKILVKLVMDRYYLIASRAILFKKEFPSMTTKASKLFVCVMRVIMKMLCQKIVFLAIRVAEHVRDNSPFPA